MNLNMNLNPEIKIMLNVRRRTKFSKAINNTKQLENPRRLFSEERKRRSKKEFLCTKLQQDEWCIRHDQVVSKVKAILEANTGLLMSARKLKKKIDSGIENFGRFESPEPPRIFKLELLTQFKNDCNKGFVGALSPKSISQMNQKYLKPNCD
jgi:hypothetical protein